MESVWWARNEVFHGNSIPSTVDTARRSEDKSTIFLKIQDSELANQVDNGERVRVMMSLSVKNGCVSLLMRRGKAAKE